MAAPLEALDERVRRVAEREQPVRLRAAGLPGGEQDEDGKAEGGRHGRAGQAWRPKLARAPCAGRQGPPTFRAHPPPTPRPFATLPSADFW